MFENEQVDFLNFVFPFIMFVILLIANYACMFKMHKNRKAGIKSSGDLVVLRIILIIALIADIIWVVPRIPILIYIQQFN